MQPKLKVSLRALNYVEIYSLKKETNIIKIKLKVQKNNLISILNMNKNMLIKFNNYI